MDFCFKWCVLSGRGPLFGLITRPEESYRMWSVWVRSRNLKNEAETHRVVEPGGKSRQFCVLKWYLLLDVVHQRKFLYHRLIKCRWINQCVITYFKTSYGIWIFSTVCICVCIMAVSTAEFMWLSARNTWGRMGLELWSPYQLLRLCGFQWETRGIWRIFNGVGAMVNLSTADIMWLSVKSTWDAMDMGL